MKTTTNLLVLFVALSTVMQAQHGVVDLPPTVHSNTTTVEVRRVTLTDTTTILDIAAFFRPGWWIRIVSDSYLLADGKKYMIRGGEGIDLDSLFWMPASGEASFKLEFEPLQADTRMFDFIESDCDECFKIWGIDLVNERVPLPEIPEEFLLSGQPDTDMVGRWKKGKAVISGIIRGYAPRFDMKARLIYLNPITMSEDRVPLTLNDDGTFLAEIDMYSPAHIRFTYDAPQADNFLFIAGPGEETKVLVNLPEANRRRSRLHEQSPGYGKKMMFAGYQSRLNDELNNASLTKNLYNDHFMTMVFGMTLRDYQNFILEQYHQAVADNNAQNVSSCAKKIINMQLAFEVNNYMMFAESYLVQAYMETNKVSWEEATKSVGSLEKYGDYNDYLKQIPFPYNDFGILLVQNLPNYLNTLAYIADPQDDKFGFFHYLIGSEKVNPEDRKTLSLYVERNQEEPIKPDSTVLAVLKTYRDLQETYFEKSRGVSYLSKVWNTGDCLLFDLIKANKISRKMEEYYPLTDEQKVLIEAFDPVMRTVILEEESLLLAKIEENKKKTGYMVLDVPDVTDENLFAEMVRPFQGKTLLVDVWATWCGPCRAANKAMEPLKAQLADKDIVYLYLTGEDSPENTWRNMIPDLHGYHYRVCESSWNYLRRSLKSDGVPTYIILDREGNQTFHSVGFPGADAMKRELMKTLAE